MSSSRITTAAIATFTPPETKVLIGIVEHMTNTVAVVGSGPLTTEQHELVEMAYGMLNAYLARKGIGIADPMWHELATTRYDPWTEPEEGS